MTVIPPYLKKGDIIGITCPAGFLDKKKAAHCVKILQSWGFEVMIGKTVGGDSENYFSGSDEERRDEFQAMLDDGSIKAILCGRGGYGSTRIIDGLNFKKFQKAPKWIIGFSDITAFHTHVQTQFSIASIHGPMASAFQTWTRDKEYLESIQACLTGKKMKYSCKQSAYNVIGKAKGILVGGNLALISHTIGTKSEIKTKNKILLIEDIGENLYAIDRMLVQLERSGKLIDVVGVVSGGFTDIKDTERPFGKTIEGIILEFFKERKIPICFDFPIGHQPQNFAIKLGIEYDFKVSASGVSLTEQR
jgi:muramoyltetrapeptide carboxypeptidase